MSKLLKYPKNNRWYPVDITKKNTVTTIPPTNVKWDKVFNEGIKISKAKGYELLKTGDVWDKLYYLEKGEVKLNLILADGRERLLWKAKAPNIIGEGLFFDGAPSNASIILTKDSTFYMFTRNWVYNTLLTKHHDLTLSIIKSLSTKTMLFAQQSIFFPSQNILYLICKVLDQHLIRKNELLYAQTDLNQQDFANVLGVHRVTLNKNLRKLEKLGIIGPYSKNETFILDEEAFQSILVE